MIDKNAIIKVMNQGGGKSKAPVFDLAVVTEVRDGKAVIRFDGDSQPSQKVYRAVKAYVPAVGDRVMLINHIILGGWMP